MPALLWRCALLLTGASFWFYARQTQKLVYKQSGQRARPNAAAIILLEHNKAERKGDAAFAKVADAFARDIRNEAYTYEKLQPDRTRVLSDGTRLARDGTIVRDGTVRGGQPGGPPLDEFDEQVLRHFQAPKPSLPDDQVDWRERQLPERNEYHYYQAVRFKENCMLCHHPNQGGRSPQGEKGDLAYVLKITNSDALMKADLNWNLAILAALAIGTAFLLVVASWFIIRYVIAKPVKHLQEVSEAISRGEMDQRADIQTARRVRGPGGRLQQDGAAPRRSPGRSQAGQLRAGSQGR